MGLNVERSSATRIASGFSYAECPRWHDGALLFADIFSGRVMRLSSSGEPEVFADLTRGRPIPQVPVVATGFGFLPDGRLVVNSMFERLVLVVDGDAIGVYADLRELAPGPINDMVVDDDGGIYVTQLGYDLWRREPLRRTPLVRIEPDGRARTLDELGDFTAANGIAISGDGDQVVLAEPPTARLVALERDRHGTLRAPRLFAQLDVMPDGVCMDREGAVWTGAPRGGGALRVRDGGEVVAKVEVPPEEAGRSVACVLGGVDRSTLFVTCGFEAYDFAKSVAEGQGSIWAADVRVGAGTARP